MIDQDKIDAIASRCVKDGPATKAMVKAAINEALTVAAPVAAERAAVPEGWRLERHDDGVIAIQKEGVGGYAARWDDNSIAASILWALADDLLAAAPSPALAKASQE